MPGRFLLGAGDDAAKAFQTWRPGGRVSEEYGLVAGAGRRTRDKSTADCRWKTERRGPSAQA